MPCPNGCEIVHAADAVKIVASASNARLRRRQMAEQEPADPPMTEHEHIERWRTHVLVDAGYPIAEAVELAKRRDVDLRQAAKLIQTGCRLGTAMEILL
jgi:hypothetical protein